MQSDNEPGRLHASLFSSNDLSPLAEVATDICGLVDQFEAEIRRGAVSRETAERLRDLMQRASKIVGD